MVGIPAGPDQGPGQSSSLKGRPAVSYSAIITDPHEADAMPMWESFDHADFDDALQAAQAHIRATQPGDRIVDEGHGVYAIWSSTVPSTRVATLVINAVSA
jgi:hypothetical protein